MCGIDSKLSAWYYGPHKISELVPATESKEKNNISKSRQLFSSYHDNLELCWIHSSRCRTFLVCTSEIALFFTWQTQLVVRCSLILMRNVLYPSSLLCSVKNMCIKFVALQKYKIWSFLKCINAVVSEATMISVLTLCGTTYCVVHVSTKESIGERLF